MNFDPQPGDKNPTDAARPGDEVKLHAHGGPNDFEGDRASTDADVTPVEEQIYAGEEGTPLGGVNFSEPFIKRPVATFLLSIAILISAGLRTRCCRWHRCRRWSSR